MSEQGQQVKVPGFVHVEIIRNEGRHEVYETRYINPRSIAEFGQKYILIDNAHSLQVRESMGEIARKIIDAALTL